MLPILIVVSLAFYLKKLLFTPTMETKNFKTLANNIKISKRKGKWNELKYMININFNESDFKNLFITYVDLLPVVENMFNNPNINFLGQTRINTFKLHTEKIFDALLLIAGSIYNYEMMKRNNVPIDNKVHVTLIQKQNEKIYNWLEQFKQSLAIMGNMITVTVLGDINDELTKLDISLKYLAQTTEMNATLFQTLYTTL